MERVFRDLLHDQRVTTNGTHWAARINAYGCANRELTEAQKVFEESNAISPDLPDSICFEAMLNVLVTNHRTDLFPEYLGRMANMGVRMTAYCANLVIKGYAATNEMDKARAMFESMSDPAFGVAAPDNHGLHESSEDGQIPFDSPVYREVSSQPL
jgi:pentatricopeptide repeat protein